MDFHNSPKVGETHMSKHRGMDKQFVVYLYNGSLPINTKDQSTNTCCNMIESRKFYAIWKDSYPKSTYCILSFL